jgi:hypothetical protein
MIAVNSTCDNTTHTQMEGDTYLLKVSRARGTLDAHREGVMVLWYGVERVVEEVEELSAEVELKV